MANENETVEQVCDKIASVAKEMHGSDYDEVWSMAFEVERHNKAVLAAHKRELAEKDAEIAELRECLKEAVEWSCGNPDEDCEDCVAHGGDTPCKCEKWRNALKGANDGNQ